MLVSVWLLACCECSSSWSGCHELSQEPPILRLLSFSCFFLKFLACILPHKHTHKHTHALLFCRSLIDGDAKDSSAILLRLSPQPVLCPLVALAILHFFLQLHFPSSKRAEWRADADRSVVQSCLDTSPLDLSYSSSTRRSRFLVERWHLLWSLNRSFTLVSNHPVAHLLALAHLTTCQALNTSKPFFATTCCRLGVSSIDINSADSFSAQPPSVASLLHL